MRRLITIAGPLLVAIVGLTGCETSQQETRAPAPQPATSESAPAPGHNEIVLDDQTGEVSLATNVYIIFDGSGSMGDPPSGACSGDRQFAFKIDGAKWALRQFVQKVPAEANLGLYVFDASGKSERVPLGPDNRADFLESVELIRDGGGTPLAGAIRYGTDRLVEQYKKQLGYGTYRLIVVTDGRASDIPEAVRYATDHGVPIYAIGLCIGNNHPLRELARSYRAADSAADLQRGLEEAVAESETFDPQEFEGL